MAETEGVARVGRNVLGVAALFAKLGSLSTGDAPSDAWDVSTSALGADMNRGHIVAVDSSYPFFGSEVLVPQRQA